MEVSPHYSRLSSPRHARPFPPSVIAIGILPIHNPTSISVSQLCQRKPTRNLPRLRTALAPALVLCRGETMSSPPRIHRHQLGHHAR